MRVCLLILIIALTGCSTERQLLELRRDRLLQLEANATEIQNEIPNGSFNPSKYDTYLALDVDVFQRIFSEIDDTRIELISNGRPITIEIDELKTEFRPGSPEISLTAKAIDKKSKLEASIDIDTRLILIGDPAKPNELTAKIHATRLVPNLRWGPWHITRLRFVRSLLALEISKLTDKLPAMRLPLVNSFSFGADAKKFDSGRINTGNGSWISGDINLPSTKISGRFIVNKILFIENGVHIFATVEGL